MAKLSHILIMISLISTMSLAQSHRAKDWSKTKRFPAKKEQVTNLQFYFHDIVSGKNPTAVRVAQAPQTVKSPTLFGALLVADDPLTETPDPKSKLVGRAQGLYGSVGQQELSLIMAMNYGFIDGIYKGSSISILGTNAAMNPVREMPVVGGTGIFRFARGYAIAQTFWFDAATGDAIVGYNVTVIH
ncbi:hypothetical protein UlMin_030900 [Ulmus minor]